MSIFETMINQQDGDVWAALEEQSIYVSGGGTISLNTGTNVLSWSEDLILLSMLSGGKVTIPAGSLSGVTDGKVVYAAVSRPIIGSVSSALAVGDVISSLSSKSVIGTRSGTNFYMKNAANREAFMSIDHWGTGKVVTSSATSGGGTVTGSISVTVSDGTVQRLQVTANGNTVDSTIQFFSDAGMTDELYSAENKDCYTTPHDDRVPWWFGYLTSGLLYYKITNDGANNSTYDIEFVGFGKIA